MVGLLSLAIVCLHEHEYEHSVSYSLMLRPAITDLKCLMLGMKGKERVDRNCIVMAR